MTASLGRAKEAGGSVPAPAPPPLPQQPCARFRETQARWPTRGPESHLESATAPGSACLLMMPPRRRWRTPLPLPLHLGWASPFSFLLCCLLLHSGMPQSQVWGRGGGKGGSRQDAMPVPEDDGAGDNMLGRVNDFAYSLRQASGSQVERSRERKEVTGGQQEEEQQQQLAPGLSPPARARQVRHWWTSPKVLTLVLLEAEEEYRKHMKLRKEVVGAGNPPFARDSPPPGAPPGPSPFTFIDRWFVPAYPCALEARLGAWGDGGKWVCLSHYQSPNSSPVVVSVGSNGDTTFEAAVWDTLGAPSHTLDFSLTEEVAERVSRLPFVSLYKVGLTGASERPTLVRKFKRRHKFYTVDEMLKLVGHDYVDVFKVDCELCEYAMVRDLKSLYTRETVPFGQVLMEIHRCADVEQTQELLGTMEELGYRLFHAEINPYGAGFNSWQYEVAYIHESLVRPRLTLLQ